MNELDRTRNRIELKIKVGKSVVLVAKKDQRASYEKVRRSGEARGWINLIIWK